MKIRPLLILVLGSALLLGGCAGGPAPRGASRLAQQRCAGGAGTLRSQSCSPFTRRYSAQALRQTGHMNAARALATLDPAVTAQGP
jgi:hypothetical protein